MNLKQIPAIAVVLIDTDVFSLNESSLEGADLIELRVDMFENIQKIEQVFATAKKKFNLPMLCTIRSLKEGGKKEIPDRLSIYEKLTPYCDFFDIEIFSEGSRTLRQKTLQNNIKLILSYHRFDLTPSVEDLENVFEEGKKLGADIIKISTMVNEIEDAEKLLYFTIKHKKDNVIVIGMGEKGRLTRIVNPVFGSLITYASLNTTSAPGQIPLPYMVKIFKEIGIRK
ncbi:type I 3-dehydroquinate dehydratase [Thermodesulfovibrio sp. 1176]|jgi:3-dehydroquinate dehydratase type I|uniref:type I 3-dehydroquinate dehydratase n=1 Tax=Thermodesulfovibrio sp. 1176 TaxID=3043424 RepID=UPI0024830346|nr:type I 3-dehydroquinate dehydratase [Thermodesulfovibrio sp. 1176]MDI1470921.1 type I 3-dehydroquinate dehydratase [Thermodesulfovibrio sp. 1176]